LVVWGPYPTAISNIIGETVGVVRDKEFAVGLQALNAKTLGGYPVSENDIEPDYGADDPGDYPTLPAELTKGQSFRGDAARRTDYGSVVQAFCRNRDRERVIANWGHEKFVAPPFHDGGVVGSKIALFACPAGKALETIGAIELAEGLPHPMLDGVWGKVATNANCSYLIVDFSEDNIERAIEMTKRAGLNYLYHSSPFETWGHFVLKRSLFPHGWDGFRACVEKAGKAGVRVGFHTLSNFITPNDAYVTPKPDPRLARIGSSVLTGEVDADQKEIPIASPDYFRKQTDMNTVVIGEELVRYGSVSSEAPWRLLNCQRGAWSSRATAHAAHSSVGKGQWRLYEVLGARFSQDASKPGPAAFQFTNTNAPQALQWVVRCDAKQPVSGLKLELGGKQVVALGETTVPAGGALKYAGGAEAVICTEAWKEVGRMPVDRQAAQAGSGIAGAAGRLDIPGLATGTMVTRPAGQRPCRPSRRCRTIAA